MSATVPGLTGWLLDALIASALLMAAVLGVRGPVRRAFGPQVAYALWALPALRLLLPPLPAEWWHAATVAPIARASGTVAVYVLIPAAQATGPSVGLVLATVWATGAVTFLACHLIRHARFAAHILRNAEPIEERDGVRIVASAAAPGPIAFGIARRYVAFPRDFATRYDPQERALALAHELGHHRRRDLHANWAALVVLALHWWNPLAWRAFRAFRADQELANDAGVLAGREAADARAYARAIVKATSPRALSAVSATCNLHTITDLKGRLTMLTTSRTSRRRLATGAAAVILLVAGGLGVTASSSAAERIGGVLAVPLPTHLIQTPPTPQPPAPGTAKKRVMIVRNGKTTTFEGAEADAYIQDHNIPVPPVPPVASTAGDPRQARTIVVSPDHNRATMLIVRRAAVTSGAPLPPDVRLPKNFELPKSCQAGQAGPAQVIKGEDGDQSYTILCAAVGTGAVGTDERSAYRQALTSLRTVRGQIATQTTPAFPDNERRDALAAVDRSITEIEADLAALR